MFTQQSDGTWTYTSEHGYTEPQLREVFDRIADPSDWKGPIECVANGESVLAVCDAIRFFTATEPKVTMNMAAADALGYIPYVITSEGYRVGPAGDH